MRTGKAQIRLRIAQSDQGSHCSLTESLDTVECINGEQMPRSDFTAHACVKSESEHFAHAQRHIFAWRGPNVYL